MLGSDCSWAVPPLQWGHCCCPSAGSECGLMHAKPCVPAERCACPAQAKLFQPCSLEGAHTSPAPTALLAAYNSKRQAERPASGTLPAFHIASCKLTCTAQGGTRPIVLLQQRSDTVACPVAAPRSISRQCGSDGVYQSMQVHTRGSCQAAAKTPLGAVTPMKAAHLIWKNTISWGRRP